MLFIVANVILHALLTIFFSLELTIKSIDIIKPQRRSRVPSQLNVNIIDIKAWLIQLI